MIPESAARPRSHAVLRWVMVLVAPMAAVLIAPAWGESPGTDSRVATVPVVVAVQDIPEGWLIGRAAVQVARWPAGTLPVGAYTTIDSLAGRVTRIAVYKGEALVPGRLAPEGTIAGLTMNVTPGKRAYGIRVNDVSSLAGMIMPGSRVDIMVVMSDPADDGKQVATLFMSNMRVLAIGPTTMPGTDGRPINAAVATIEVTPEESEKLAIAAAQGSLHLVLRGYGDPDSVTAYGVTAADIVEGRRESRAPPSPLRPQPR